MKVKQALRIYAPTEFGVVTRIGRTFRTWDACKKAALDLSSHFKWVEIQDDNKPINRRLQAIIRNGNILSNIEEITV